MKHPFTTPVYDSDKIQLGLMEEYKTILNPLVHYPVTILELGVHHGGSVQYWDNFLKSPDATIIGMDLKIPDVRTSDRVKFIECDQNDTDGLKSIARTYQEFDLIIDDASHFAKETINCWDVFWDHLKPGGYYVIEDWAVGYIGDKAPVYAGMVSVITDIMSELEVRSIGSFKVILEEGKSMAFFQKK